jgi:hypothetical protein
MFRVQKLSIQSATLALLLVATNAAQLGSVDALVVEFMDIAIVY